MAIENRLRQRLDLQQTRRQQLQFKEAKRQAEREEEEEFRRKVRSLTVSFLNETLPLLTCGLNVMTTLYVKRWVKRRKINGQILSGKVLFF